MVVKLILIVVTAALALVPLPRAAVERAYAGGVYPLVQPALTTFSNHAPFALFDVVLGAAVVSIATMWAVGLRGRGPRTRMATAGRLALDTSAVAAVLYLWFLAAWGMNYRREPLREQFDFREDRITREALHDLARRNTQALNALYRDAHAAGWPELAATPDALRPAFERAQRDLAMPWTAVVGRPKRSVLNFYFTRVSIDGMTNPFFLETLANQTLLPFERTATVAHEWSHLAGYADESEANFLGWLVCMRGDRPAQYSGWLSLYGTVINALPRSERDDMIARLDAGPRADLQAVSDRIRRHTIPIANRAGYALYDRFLKANTVDAGIRSYGEVLRLLLGTRFGEDGAPIRRHGRS